MEPFSSHSGLNRSSYTTSSVPFRLDEGFSEALPSQEENEQTASAAAAATFQAWIMSQNEESRVEIAYEVLRTLRTSNIAAVVERLTPLLHMDPVEKLPPEITAEIFSYLDASTLLTASLASRTWRERILDPRLWKKLYLGQGWGINREETKSFEKLHGSLLRYESRKAKIHQRGSDSGLGQPQHKKRATAGKLYSRAQKFSGETPRWREQYEAIEPDTEEPTSMGDHEMQDAPDDTHTQLSPPRPNKRHSQDSGDEMEVYSRDLRQGNLADAEDSTTIELHPPLKPALLLKEPSGDGRLSWSFLYKQRRRLEENWAKGRFTNFQLPHPQYPHEAHTECVYTIQFFGKWLVSGSRDKSLRIWDLETRRLRGKPLIGHTQSVLCLQFDPTEDEDVIISGSSDTSVIVWRFSTGQKIHEIQQAHSESVLNLRFDRRYLVTCSKDRMIKVWNRRDLLPSDSDYPRMSPKSDARMPQYIIDIAAMSPIQISDMIDMQNIKPLRPYTNLMILRGHGAAVNAIQIDKNQIVSASGDRHIKIWDVRDGRCIRTLQGHQKGIACVQFDSKRIVSGSSDNTVRIYDHATGVELATLQGHTNLVRTVQAGFGDLPGSDEELESQARAAERTYVEGLINGSIVEDRPIHGVGRRPRTNSSLTPSRNRISFGASLPPGGGGSQWGRIVSGSYDESIIIWKKDANGDWIIGQKLQQEAAVRAIQERARAAAESNRHSLLNVGHGVGPASGAGVAGPSSIPPLPATHVVQQVIGTSMAGLSAGVQNVLNVGGHLAGWNLPPANGQVTQQAPLTTGWLAPGAQQAMHQLTAHAQNVMIAAMNQQQQQQLAHAQAQQQQAQQLPQVQGTAGTAPPAPAPILAPSLLQPQPPTQLPALPPPVVAAAAAAPQLQPQLHPAPPQQQQPPPPPHPQQSVSRVFKLQFDARRIVCCSQDSRIIGWDFANGDSEIAEASRFFIGP